MRDCATPQPFLAAIGLVPERYMRCRDCSRLQGQPYKRSHLVALRMTKISATDPPSTWWPGKR